MVAKTLFILIVLSMTYGQLIKQHTYDFNQCGVSSSINYSFPIYMAQTKTVNFKTNCSHQHFDYFRGSSRFNSFCGNGWGHGNMVTKTVSFAVNLDSKFNVFPYQGASQNCCFQIQFTVDFSCSIVTDQCHDCTNYTTCLSCISGFFIHINQCKTCSQIIPNCISCLFNSTCSACDHNSVLNKGKCSTCPIQNCLECPNISTCSQCEHPYELDSQGQCNNCKSPFYFISNLCSPERFCISAKKDSNENVVCNFCDYSKNYQIDSSSRCVCRIGYQSNNQVCQEICGDGIIFNAECDDNNTIDGDGCSSECKVQSPFLCSKAGFGVSECKLNLNIKFKLHYIDKIMNQNKAIMYFDLQTNNFNIQTFFLSDLFNFTLSSNRSETIRILNFQKKSKGKVAVEIEFNQTIENTAINLVFEFSQNHIMSQNNQLKFILKGRNYGLIISHFHEQYHQINQIEIYFIGCSYAIVLFFLLSDKFIAVQALCSFQIVYFSLLMIYKNSSWTQALSTVLPLKYAMGFNQLLYQQTTFANLRDESFSKYRYLKMCQPFLMNNFTNSSILFVLSVIFLVLFFIKNRLQNSILRDEDVQKKKQARKSLRFFRKIFKKTYNLTFHFSYVMIFEVLVSLYIESAYMKNISLELKIMSKFAAMWTFTTIIFTILDQFKHLFFTHKQMLVESFKVGIIQSRYKAIYLAYIFINAIVMCLMNDKLIFGIPPSSLLVIFAILYLLFLLIYRPYQYQFGINGFTVIVNHSIYIITLVLISVMNYEIYLEQLYLLMFCYTLLGFCVLIVVLTFVRIFLDYKYGADRLVEEMRKQEEQRRKIQQNQLCYQPDHTQIKISQVQKQKYKRNQYIYINRLKKEKKINFLNELKAKTFLREQDRDSIYYRFYYQKPLDWVQKHEKRIKYQYLLQKEKEQLEKDLYKKDLDHNKQQKKLNTAQMDDLTLLKNKMKAQFEEKKVEKENKKKEKKRLKQMIKFETNLYDYL